MATDPDHIPGVTDDPVLQLILSGRAETFPSQAGDAEMIVGAFQQEHGQAMGSDSQVTANRRNVRKDVKRTGGHQDFHIFHPPKFFNQ